MDGDSHFKSNAEEYDKAHQEYIETFGIQFLLFTNEEVCKNIEGMCYAIWNKIERIVEKRKILA